MMKYSFAAIAALPFAAFAQHKPNVVVVFVDQLAPWALSCYNGEDIKTPNIDRLANSGVVFNNAYCVKAVSTPSRGSMLTGLYPFAHQAVNNQQLLDTEVETYADVLNRAGYHTGYIGKWHLAGHMGKNADGSADPNWNPAINGNFKDATYMYNNGHWKNIVQVKNGIPKVSNNISNNPDEYGTDWLFERGFEYISRHKGESFCLVLSPPDPHPGMKVRKPYDKLIDPAAVSLPISFTESNLTNMGFGMWDFSQYKNESALRRDKSQYLGMVLCLDDYMGKLENHLKNEGVWDNTIVIFTSDHGEMMGSFRHKGKVLPMNDSYHIPLIVKPAANKNVGRRVNQLYSNVDFKSTLAGLLNLPTNGKEHGKDMSVFIIKRNEEAENKEDVIFMDFTQGQQNTTHVAVVTPQYWFAPIFESGANSGNTRVREVLLFDRQKDTKQLVNLHGSRQWLALERELLGKLRSEFERINHPNLKDLDLIENTLQ